MAEEEIPKISELDNVPIQPTQWYTLGITLGLEEEVLNNIEQEQSHKHPKCKRAMFRKWLESNPTASWDDLIKALVQIGDKQTAEKVKEQFYPSPFIGSADLPGDGNHHRNNNSERQGEDEIDFGVCDLVS